MNALVLNGWMERVVANIFLMCRRLSYPTGFGGPKAKGDCGTRIVVCVMGTGKHSGWQRLEV